MSKIKTKGTLLQVSISSTFTTVAQRIRIVPNERTRNEIETTDLDDDDATSVAGIRRAGEVELEGYLDPEDATHAYLEASYASGAIEAWKHILANSAASEYAYSGWIMSFQLGEQAIDGTVRFTIKIKITGAVTHTG